jgi:hypothetical protein
MNAEKLDRLLQGVRREVPPSADLWASIATQLEPRAAAPRRAWTYALAAGIAVAALTAAVAWQYTGRPAMPVATTAPGAAVQPATPRHASGMPEASGPAVAPDAAGGTPRAVGESRALLAAAFEAPRDERYRATRAALERTFRERLDLLAPETRQRIEQNLEIIRKANDEIRDALAADPNSPLLRQLLESTWQQEIDLYTTVSRNTEPAVRTAT